MSEKIKFLTIHDTWIAGEDVEDPEILKDPSEYYDWLFASKNESDLLKYDDEGNDIDEDTDWDNMDDIIDLL